MKISTLKEKLGELKELKGKLETNTHALDLDGIYQAQKGDMTVIAAQTGKGKSTLLASKALKDSLEGLEVLYLTSEVKGEELDKLLTNVKIEQDFDELNIHVGETDSQLDSESIVQLVESFVAEGNKVDKVYVDHFVLKESQSMEEAMLEMQDLNVVISIQLSK